MSRPKKGQEHPREEYRDKIRLMVAIGIPKDHIAGLLKMSKDTLYKAYTEELETGASSANAVVGGKIFEAAKRGEQWACTLWAVRRMGWKETNATEITGKDGGAIQQELKADEAARAFLNEFAKLKAAAVPTNAVVADRQAGTTSPGG